MVSVQKGVPSQANRFTQQWTSQFCRKKFILSSGFYGKAKNTQTVTRTRTRTRTTKTPNPKTLREENRGCGTDILQQVVLTIKWSRNELTVKLWYYSMLLWLEEMSDSWFERRERGKKWKKFWSFLFMCSLLQFYLIIIVSP